MDSHAFINSVKTSWASSLSLPGGLLSGCNCLDKRFDDVPNFGGEILTDRASFGQAISHLVGVSNLFIGDLTPASIAAHEV